MRRQLDVVGGDTVTVYESLSDDVSLVKRKSCCKQLCSCVRCSIVICFSIAIVIALLVVLPLKILLSDNT